MSTYFGSVHFAFEADDTTHAQDLQDEVIMLVESLSFVKSADEIGHPELDEFGHYS